VVGDLVGRGNMMKDIGGTGEAKVVFKERYSFETYDK